MVKTVSKLAEEGKVALRNIRRDVLKEISGLDGMRIIFMFVPILLTGRVELYIYPLVLTI